MPRCDWLAAHPNLAPPISLLRIVCRQCSLLTQSPSKYTSSVPGNCLIWAGTSPEQGQARVTQIWMNCFWSLRCHSPYQTTLFFCQKFTPFPVPVSTRAVLGISEGHRVTFKSRLNPPVPPDFGTKDDTALVVTRCGALVPPPDQPPTKTKATRVQGLRF